ncbi:hypothetical protein AHF37_07894 [Paragonimus kellicotti]|nr:hypothetical protein AHF37_07894 [Paragonimus kellicotti]
MNPLYYRSLTSELHVDGMDADNDLNAASTFFDDKPDYMASDPLAADRGRNAIDRLESPQKRNQHTNVWQQQPEEVVDPLSHQT